MMYHCCEERRRNDVADHPTLNGIDFLEVLDRDAPLGSPRQRTLLVRMLKPVPAGWTTDNVAIVGGERIVNPGIEWMAPASNLPTGLTPAEVTFLTALPFATQTLVIRTEISGDFSTYCLRLQRSVQDTLPPDGIDPRLATISFSFKVECPSDFDCQSTNICQDPPEEKPDINYLAKDYSGFRRLMLDRISQLVPNWRTRNAADLGVTLTEAIAYVGDQMSYWQDAIATEAYLDTARKRTSLRRHARLVDYQINDGRNARCWVHIAVNGASVTLPKDGLHFFTRVPHLHAQIAPGSQEETRLQEQHPFVFEPLTDSTLFQAHNHISFYSWGDEQCCLPKGATQATLEGHFPELQVGDMLVFEEVLGPLTGQAEDADPAHRHVVRLTKVDLTNDPLHVQDITEIVWQPLDAVPFPLCISSVTDEAHGSEFLKEVSVARGNLVLVDHGKTIEQEDLGQVIDSGLNFPRANNHDRCAPDTRIPVPPRYRPRLNQSPLTHAAKMSLSKNVSASEYLLAEQAEIIPEITLSSTTNVSTDPWAIRRTLLNSHRDDRHFVVETEHDQNTFLRFGNDRHGRRPEVNTAFTARYRIGNGARGNVGAEAIAHVLSNDGRIQSIRNPLPAVGGQDPETAAQIKRRAPQAFRHQERAVTPEDYAEVTERHEGIQRAAAQLRWTGSWHTMFITVDQENGLSLDSDNETRLHTHVEPFRMAGHDLEFNDPIFVSLEMDLRICVDRNYFRSHVKQALLGIFTKGLRQDGQLGLFHPDNFSFGQTLYLSPFYAAAREVAGVDSVQITRFHEQGTEDFKPLSDGFMTFGRLEIPRLDNDPNFPEHGVLRLELVGGK